MGRDGKPAVEIRNRGGRKILTWAQKSIFRGKRGNKKEKKNIPFLWLGQWL